MPVNATTLVKENTTFDSARIRWDVGPVAVRQPLLPAGIRIVLIGSIAPGWKLVQPLTVTIELDGDSYVASDELFFMYGLGDDRATALNDYISVLTEYYELLATHEDAPSMELLNYLKSYLLKQ